MTQNIYDKEDFFKAYGRLRRSVEGLDGAPESPSLRSLLPNLRGRRVLDLGCGYGWFCRWARENGAAQVFGIDVSEKMLARARSEKHDAIVYHRDDMETLTLSPDSYDLAYSSLAFHYVENLDRLWSQVYHSLVPGGRFVFSVEHPIYTAPSEPGWASNSAGRKTWPVDQYLEEGPRTTDWLAKGVVKQHRTLATCLNLLIRLDFAVTHVEEWGPTAAQIAAEPEWAESEHERPPFLLVAATR
jgi:SAM-dependent methyltransferase